MDVRIKVTAEDMAQALSGAGMLPDPLRSESLSAPEVECFIEVPDTEWQRQHYTTLLVIFPE